MCFGRGPTTREADDQREAVVAADVVEDATERVLNGSSTRMRAARLTVKALTPGEANAVTANRRRNTLPYDTLIPHIQHCLSSVELQQLADCFLIINNIRMIISVKNGTIIL